VITILLIVVLILGDSLLALAAGLVGRARGRRFWLWALIGLVFPVVAIVVVLVLPRGRR